MNVEVSFLSFGDLCCLSISIAVPKGSALTLSIEHPLLFLLRQWTERKALDDPAPDNSCLLEPSIHPIVECNRPEDKQEEPQCRLSFVELLDPCEWTQFEDLLRRVDEGLSFFPPELCEEGVNGTYFLKDRTGKRIAVFKPQDEEGNSKNNPKQSSGSDLNNKRIPTGQGVKREVSAYLLDKEAFYSVPRTTMVNVTHSGFCLEASLKVPVKKTGSLQEYVENDGASWDIGPNSFPAQEVQKIGILDLQIFNNDRHDGNILFQRKGNSYKLIPIDHGFSLPHALDRAWFEWMNWPQAMQPFSPESLAYIERIDIEKDSKMLESKLGMTADDLRSMKISTTLLKKGAAMGLTLHQIARMVCRENLNEPSALEKMLHEATEKVEFTGNESLLEKETKLLRVLSRLMDEEIATRVHKNVQG